MEKDEYGPIRQVSIASLNETVNLLSNSDSDDMEYLTGMALKLLNKIKENGQK